MSRVWHTAENGAGYKRKQAYATGRSLRIGGAD